MTTPEWTIEDQDQRIAEAVKRDEPGLRRFIRRRVLDTSDAEDILQDVFYEFIAAYRLLKPAEEATAWLFRVARNRITDLFRRRRPLSLNEPMGDADESLSLEDLLPSPDAGPDAVYARSLLYEALEDALEELPAPQRDVFVAHEFEGRSFRELSEESGTPMNTLLSRKRYAVLHLRRRLKEISQNFTEGRGRE